VRPLALLLFTALLCSATPARADGDDAGDGLYGRLDTDLRLSVAAGAGARSPGTAPDVAPIGLVELRARYLDSAGVFVASDSDDGRWRVSGGVELRPLFLARFLLDRESGRSYLDLLVDSFGLELGVAATHLTTLPTAALVLGVGLDVPLVIDPFRLAFRVGFRWTYAGGDGRPDVTGAPRGEETDVVVLGALVVDVGVNTGLAARQGPRARRVP